MTVEQQRMLCDCFLFAGLPQETALGFCEGLTVETVAAGKVIYSAEHFRRAVVVLLSGRAEVLGRDGVVLNLLGPGDCFGVAAVFNTSREYVTTVTAVTDTALCYLDDDWLGGLFGLEPATAINYISFLSEKICFLNRKIDGFTANTAAEAVALWLTRHAREGRVEVPQGYTKLARELNLGRASLYRALDGLEADGKLSRTGKTILLLTDHLSGKDSLL